MRVGEVALRGIVRPDAASCAVWFAATSSGKSRVAVRRYYERLPLQEAGRVE
ncbi:hypothetical protein DYI24_18340 [Rhodopseudomonas sp. BR0C11]|uniref:hypothetical protein n=1 Tax=Rhodopseudomonas sp. BR0C11 TaxID=2269370 RepID=UPI0013E00D73|nr:hypothetical protein [Rhodopseudomonas sp. BR0C11]NEV78998.1 hypothetical protein [Rhodopseudomonas sp. BR0C11]